MKLSFELLIFQFELFGMSPLLMQLLVEFLQLIFVMAFGASDLLVSVKDPAGGKSFQIRAPIPIRATEVVRQVFELWHGQSGGGSWSSRQLASERR